MGITPITTAIEETPTVEEFFNLYDELFYDIPALGETNSHEYLVRTSGEYINFEEQSEIIEALQQEISLLREENLQLQISSIENTTGQSINFTGSLTPPENGG